MIARALVLAACVLAAPVRAQTPPDHLFEIRGGHVLLDGSVLPDAIPDGLDLSGLVMSLAYSGPITPVVEVDGQAYVLEQGRLVRFEESSRAGQGVYILGEAEPDLAAMPDDRLVQVSQEAYRREVAARDQQLFDQMQAERALEEEVARLGESVRRLPEGSDRSRLRAELHARLSELFTLKQGIRHAELDRAQEEIDAVRSQLGERERRRDAIIEGRLRRLCDEVEASPRNR